MNKDIFEIKETKVFSKERPNHFEGVAPDDIDPYDIGVGEIVFNDILLGGELVGRIELYELHHRIVRDLRVGAPLQGVFDKHVSDDWKGLKKYQVFADYLQQIFTKGGYYGY